jgi:6-phosphogluconolactonase
MTPIQVISSGGKTPRGFNIEPSGRYLFAGNQESDEVVTFAIDPQTGCLSPTGAKASVPRPVCIKFAVL